MTIELVDQAQVLFSSRFCHFPFQLTYNSTILISHIFPRRQWKRLFYDDISLWHINNLSIVRPSAENGRQLIVTIFVVLSFPLHRIVAVRSLTELLNGSHVYLSHFWRALWGMIPIPFGGRSIHIFFGKNNDFLSENTHQGEERVNAIGTLKSSQLINC